MKTIVEINSTNYASTGNIMINIAKMARNNNYRIVECCKNSKESTKHLSNDQIMIGGILERNCSDVLAYITGLRDHFNLIGTYSFINKLKKIKPDLIHIHTLHDNFINIYILFNYIKKINIPVIWTFHDCNAFTGQCPCFDMVNCQKWQNNCGNCPQLTATPGALFDTTSYILNKKKQLFKDLPNLTITTPSNWLKNKVKESLFSSYDCLTINNGIDLNVFKPVKSNFKEKYNIKEKYIVLGVANKWAKRKGIDDFIELAATLPDNYQIVLIGTNDQVDKTLPKNIISIHRTYNQKELVEIYSASDVFVNPTKEEVFGLVNVEALACGIPVITYNTGGCPEIIDNTCGVVVDKGDIKSLYNNILDVCANKKFKQEDCLNRAKNFNCDNIYKQFIELYNKKLAEPRI